jgi:sugar/nucleoside kinase (ribokinase family)
MNCLGGGVNHAAMGMRVWSDRVGVVAKIGNDFPENLMAKISTIFNVEGLEKCDMNTMRAWQYFAADGTRREELQYELEDFEPLKPNLSAFPESFTDLSGSHLHCEGDEVVRWAPFLRTRGKNPFILWEPWQRDCVPENREKLSNILPLVDCVSPNLEEARLLLGKEDIGALVSGFLDFGAERVVIRAGAEGSMYADVDGNFIRVPAVKVEKIVDHTGAGNAYCGGLVVGYVISEKIEDALCRAAVSASFPLEQFGALFSLEGIQQRVEDRFRACKEDLLRINFR